MTKVSLKGLLTKIVQWIQNPLKAQGTANTDCFYLAKRTDTGTQVGFGIGSGGTNHGIWSHTQSKWLIYGDASTNVYVNGIKIGKDSAVATNVGSYITAGQVKAYYHSGTITIYFENVTFGTISTSMTTVANIPAKFRPLSQVYGNFYSTSLGIFYVSAAGDVKVSTSLSGKSGIVGTVTYVAWNYT